MQCSRSYCQAEFRSALLPSICQLAADDNAFPWFVPSLTLFRWLYTTRTVSVRLFLSRRPLSLPLPRRPAPLPLHLHGHPFNPAPLFPFLHRIGSSLSAYGHVRTMQRSNGFVIELPSTANFILFWESADTHARAPRSRTPRREMKFVRLFVARDRTAPDVGNFAEIKGRDRGRRDAPIG